MVIFITLTTAGAATGPFDLFSNANGYSAAFETGVPKAALLAGYTTLLAPAGTTIVRIKSSGICTNQIDVLVFPCSSTTTTTSSSTSSTTSTSTSSTTSTTSSTTSTTSTSSTTSTTSSTSTTSTTTSTTTTDFCISNGFPQFAYAVLFWSQGEIDTSTTITCNGNPVTEPSQSKAVWLAFFADPGLTTPLATTLNNYPVTVGGTPYLIGAGTTEFAYFIDYFPYSSNPVDLITCIPGATVFEPLPSLSADTCFTVISSAGIADGNMTIKRGPGDPTTNGYTADLANCLYLPGSGTPIEVVISAGQAGPITQSNIAGYCNITVRSLVLGQGYTITILGTANDGSSGETITVPLAISTQVTSIKNYFLDSNHSIMVTVDEVP